MAEKSNNFVKVLAIVLQNDQGVRFYSKYYLKHFAKSVYCTGGSDLSKVEHQRVFEKALLSKAKRMEVLGIMKPEDSTYLTQHSRNIYVRAVRGPLQGHQRASDIRGGRLRLKLSVLE